MLRAAAEISAESHIIAMQNVGCGNYESEAESLFRFVGHNYGARFQVGGWVGMMEKRKEKKEKKGGRVLPGGG